MEKPTRGHLLGRLLLSVLAYLAVVGGTSYVVLNELPTLLGEPEPLPIYIPDIVDLVEFAPAFFGVAALGGFAAGFASGGFWVGIIGGLVGADLTAVFIAATSGAPPLLWIGILMLTSGPSRRHRRLISRG